MENDKNMSIKESNKGLYIVVGLVVLLLTFSIVQAVQLNNLKHNSIGQESKYQSSSKTTTPTSQNNPVPQQVPSMVGGC